MPALDATDFFGEIVWLGRVLDRYETLLAQPVDALEMSFAGPAQEGHGGLTRPSCSRVVAQYPVGTEIRNTRQVTVLSEEELAEIARELGLSYLDPSLLGANVVIKGIPNFTLIPPSSRLQNASGTTLTVDMENRPCNLVTREIGIKHNGQGKAFRAAAEHRRGITAWVEREGGLSIGDRLRLHIPSQPRWPQQ